VIEANTLDDAFNQLYNDKADKHPEKRVKAAWNEYVEAHLPDIKKEYPGLKRN